MEPAEDTIGGHPRTPLRRARHIVLMGMMGAGKTTVGKPLAGQLGVRYLDNDAILTEVLGSTAAEYADQHGVTALHQREASILATTLAAGQAAVIAAPGSIALWPSAKALLRGHTTVWLRAQPATLAQHVRLDSRRPLLAAATDDAVTDLLAAREAVYARLATVTIDVDGRPVQDIVDEVVACLGSSGTTWAALRKHR